MPQTLGKHFLLQAGSLLCNPLSPYFIAFLPKSGYRRRSQRLDLGRAKVPDLFSRTLVTAAAWTHAPPGWASGQNLRHNHRGCRSRPLRAPARRPAASGPRPGPRAAHPPGGGGAGPAAGAAEPQGPALAITWRPAPAPLAAAEPVAALAGCGWPRSSGARTDPESMLRFV